MSRFAVVVGLFGACSGPTRPVAPSPAPSSDAAITSDAAVDAAPLPVTELDYQLPVATAAPVSDCRPVRANKVSGIRTKTYDFTAITVRPLRHGPTVAERPYIDYDKTLDTARSVLASRSDEITACWRWASARGAKETTLAVELTLDPRGSTSNVAVTSAQAGDDELVACVKDMLAPPSWGQPRARATRVHGFLGFNNDMAPAAKRPARPKAPKARKAHVATICAGTAQEPDEVFVPLLLVSNWDNNRPEANGLVMPRQAGCDLRTREVDKAVVRISLRSQQGAFDACYADAIARAPSLVGDVGAKLVFDRTGYARNVEVAGSGDDAFHGCMTAALEAMWVVPWSQDLEVVLDLAFTLVPTRPSSADPTVLLDAGDFDAALVEWTNLLRSPHLPYQGCLAHAGIVHAMTFVAPWLDDERVRLAIGNLAQSVLALPADQGRSCVMSVEGVLRSYARMQGGVYPPPDPTIMHHLERYEAMLPLAGFFEWGPKLRWYHAYYLLRTDRASEGEDLLADLARDPVIGGEVTHWLEQRTKRPPQLHDDCPRR